MEAHVLSLRMALVPGEHREREPSLWEGNVAVAVLLPLFGSPLIASGADFVPG